MSPEAQVALFLKRVPLPDGDADHLISLLQEARGLGSLAGAEATREACAELVETWIAKHAPAKRYVWDGGELVNLVAQIRDLPTP